MLFGRSIFRSSATSHRVSRHRVTGHRRQFTVEPLEKRMLLAADVFTSEFLAENDNGISDEDGDREDWIEITNATDTAVDLSGWHLTDNDRSLAKWTFPTTVLEPGEWIVVFASNKDRTISGTELHSNFRLDNAGEYLALVRFPPTPFSPFFPSVGTGPTHYFTDSMVWRISATAPLRDRAAIWKLVWLETSD